MHVVTCELRATRYEAAERPQAALAARARTRGDSAGRVERLRRGTPPDREAHVRARTSPDRRLRRGRTELGRRSVVLVHGAVSWSISSRRLAVLMPQPARRAVPRNPWNDVRRYWFSPSSLRTTSGSPPAPARGHTAARRSRSGEILTWLALVRLDAARRATQNWGLPRWCEDVPAQLGWECGPARVSTSPSTWSSRTRAPVPGTQPPIAGSAPMLPSSQRHELGSMVPSSPGGDPRAVSWSGRAVRPDRRSRRWVPS
jgi:hypothetical protein